MYSRQFFLFFQSIFVASYALKLFFFWKIFLASYFANANSFFYFNKDLWPATSLSFLLIFFQKVILLNFNSCLLVSFGGDLKCFDFKQRVSALTPTWSVDTRSAYDTSVKDTILNPIIYAVTTNLINSKSSLFAHTLILQNNAIGGIKW